MSPDWSAKVMPVPYAKMADPESLNLYAYVRNSPLSTVDSDGHMGSAAEATAQATEDWVSGSTPVRWDDDKKAKPDDDQEAQPNEESINSVTPRTSKGIEPPPAVPGILVINTVVDSSSSDPSSAVGGHAWLEFTTDDGVTYPYGTYGNDNGAQHVHGVNEDSELPLSSTANRSEHISADQARHLSLYIADMIRQGPGAWSAAWPCSGFAAVGWNLTTGENLDPSYHGILNSPTNLQGAIVNANGGTN